MGSAVNVVVMLSNYPVGFQAKQAFSGTSEMGGIGQPKLPSARASCLPRNTSGRGDNHYRSTLDAGRGQGRGVFWTTHVIPFHASVRVASSPVLDNWA
jgi:hypothetical protein